MRRSILFFIIAAGFQLSNAALAISIDYYAITQLASGQGMGLPAHSLSTTEHNLTLSQLLILLCIRVFTFYFGQFLIGSTPTIYANTYRKYLFQQTEKKFISQNLSSSDSFDLFGRQTQSLGVSTTYTLKLATDIILVILLASIAIKSLPVLNINYWFVFILALAIIIFFYIKKLTKIAVSSNEAQIKLNNNILSTLANYKTLFLSQYWIKKTQDIDTSTFSYSLKNGYYFLLRAIPRFHSDTSIILASIALLLIGSHHSNDGQNTHHTLAIVLVIIRLAPLSSQVVTALGKITSAIGPIKETQAFLKRDWSTNFSQSRLDQTLKNLKVKNLNLTETSGVVILSGSSGSGKSYITEILTGLHGDILKDNVSKNISTYLPKEKNKYIKYTAMINDNSLSLLSKSDIRALVSNNNTKNKYQKNLINYVNNFLDKNEGISTGQSTIIRFLIACNQDSDITIFDEPSNGIDKETLITVAQLITAVSQEKHILLITHDESFLNLLKNISQSA